MTVILNILVESDFGFQECLDVYYMYKVAHFPTNALQQIALQLCADSGQYQRICTSVKVLEGWKRKGKKSPAQKRQRAYSQVWRCSTIMPNYIEVETAVNFLTFTFFHSSCLPLLLSPPPQNLFKCQTDLRSRLFKPSISVGGGTLQDFLT